jgi:hypothetical protein
MRQILVMFSLIVGLLACFSSYGLALIDWVQGLHLGIYEKNWAEAVLETVALGLYTYLAIRFLRTKALFL